jgi:N,N-dimethylformamidase beta subunit-like protein
MTPGAHDAPSRQAWSDPRFTSERPSGRGLEIWCYTDRFSYRAGEQVAVRVHSTAPRFSLTVVRDGAEPTTVLRLEDLGAAVASTPDDAYAVGCDWPVATSFHVGSDWVPGLYLLIVRAQEPAGASFEREHFIVVRADTSDSRASTALLLTTCTLLAYNDWGGANHYRGREEIPWVDAPSPFVSARRPVARGFLRLPAGAPREAAHHTPGPHEPPRYPPLEWAHQHGYSRHYGDAFWASYERPFVCWAERAGYTFDYLTQHDLHLEPGALAGYETVVIVGHDEYWTWQMRDAVDEFVDGGGLLARFAGNFTWQVRLSEHGDQQTCFKDPALDPLASDPQLAHLTSTRWEAVGRPPTLTMGLSGLTGIYNRYGYAAPRSAGGFTVYRPEHWALSGTGLCYGDLLGGPPSYAAAFELDGVDYTFRDGLPFPTGSDAAPESLEIVALAPAVIGEIDQWGGRYPLNASEAEAAVIHSLIDGRRIERRRYGSGMVASFERGRGTVFNAGSTEWVHGLIQRDPFVEAITHNVLRRRLEVPPRNRER